MDNENPQFASSEAGALGGNARAKKLSKEQRAEIARKGAAARWIKAGHAPIYKATHTGELRLGRGSVDCAVLEDGTRLISQRGLAKAFGTGVPSGSRREDGLPAFLSSKNLKQFVDDDFRAKTTHIVYVMHGGFTAHGIRAEAIPAICDVWLKARDAKVLYPRQQHIAEAADIIMRGLAHVGIVALVDEATGYQADRARDALAKILEAFVAKELQKWVSTFRIDYYENLFRLWGQPYDPQRPTMKRPQFFGTLTNNIVYERLAPGVLKELRKRNPVTESGGRSAKHFQLLTTDFGHPKLKEHLAAVTALMRATKTKEDFIRLLDQALPKYKPAPLFDGEAGSEPVTN